MNPKDIIQLAIDLYDTRLRHGVEKPSFEACLDDIVVAMLKVATP